MNAEFNWWLLIVGLVIGAGLVYLVLADGSRRDSEVEERELPLEAGWIAAALRAQGVSLDPDVAEHVLRLHREYLAAAPGDEEATDLDATDVEAADVEAADVDARRAARAGGAAPAGAPAERAETIR